MPASNLHFLVVEDQPFQRRTLVRMLASLGAKNVYEAMDGSAALAVVQDPARHLDIVISDLEMPGMDGMEFLRHLGESGVSTSVILTSALDRNLIASVETMTVAYGVDLLGVVEKPLSREKLESLVRLFRSAPAVPDRRRATEDSFTLEEIAASLKNDQFEPFFQPKVELATGRVKGAEALARWRHPHKGIVAPYAFVGQMETNGLIDELTWVMLTKAAAFCREWRKTGQELTVSVNLSIKSLNETRVADRLTELVRSQNLEPRHVVFELTESATTNGVGHLLENLARLRMRGFGLSIDDYGTGYSSMQQLTRIAFTELKIDKSFVTNVGKKESARVILESSLEMARKLNITAVAEGVETETDWTLLRELGCDQAQGYFIAKPMEAAACLDWERIA